MRKRTWGMSKFFNGQTMSQNNSYQPYIQHPGAADVSNPRKREHDDSPTPPGTQANPSDNHSDTIATPNFERLDTDIFRPVESDSDLTPRTGGGIGTGFDVLAGGVPADPNAVANVVEHQAPSNNEENKKEGFPTDCCTNSGTELPSPCGTSQPDPVLGKPDKVPSPGRDQEKQKAVEGENQ